MAEKDITEKNLEKRMEDVKNRYGYYPQAKYDKNTELKTYFEKLMGKDLNQYFNEKK